MEKQFLLEDETILVQSNDSSVVLTNRRLLKNIDLAGDGYFISMHLHNISTIEISFKSAPILIILGVISALAGLALGMKEKEPGIVIVGIGLGLILILLYVFTRYHFVNVASNGGARLFFRTKGMKKDAVLDLVKKIDQAKSLIK